MSIKFNDNILNRTNKDQNDKTGVYENNTWKAWNSIEEALSSDKLVKPYRNVGLTIYVLKGGQLTEYWFRDGVEDNQLIEKQSFGRYFNISGIDFASDGITYNNTQLANNNYTVEYLGSTSGGGSFDKGKLIEGIGYTKLTTGGFTLNSIYKVTSTDIFQISNAFNTTADGADKANISGAAFTGEVSAPIITAGEQIVIPTKNDLSTDEIASTALNSDNRLIVKGNDLVVREIANKVDSDAALAASNDKIPLNKVGVATGVATFERTELAVSKADSADAKAIVAQEDAEDAYNEALAKIPLAQKDAVGGVPNIDTVPLRTTVSGIRALTGTLKTTLFTTTDTGQEGLWKQVSGIFTSADDNTGTFLVDTLGRGFQRVFDGFAIEAKWFGVSSTVVDNQPLLTIASTVAKAANMILDLPAGNVPITSIWRPDGIFIRSNNTTLVNNRQSSVGVEIGSNTTLSGLKIDGAYDPNITATRVCIQAKALATNIRLDFCDFYNCNNNAMTALNQKDFKMTNCRFYSNAGNLQFFDGGENITIENCQFRDTLMNVVGEPVIPALASGGNGVSMNRNNNNQTYKNLSIVGNLFKNLRRMGFEAFNVIDSNITRNTVDNTVDMGMSFPLLRNSNITYNNINDWAAYGIEIPGTNGGNNVCWNRITNPKTSSAATGIILSTFASTTLIGTVDVKYDTVADNRFKNIQNLTNTYSAIKVKVDTVGTPLNDSYINIVRNRFLNSTGIVFEGGQFDNHRIHYNEWILDANTISIPRFLSIGGKGHSVKGNIIKVANVPALAATPQGQCMSISLCTDIEIEGNTMELGDMFQYGIRETSACTNSDIYNNKIVGATIESVLHNVSGGSVRRFFNNGTISRNDNLSSQTNGSTIITDFNTGQILSGAGDPEGVVIAKLGSLYIRNKSRSGATDSIGTMYIKNYQSGSVDSNTGWSMISAPIVDSALTTTTSTFGNINSKYPVARYPKGTFVFFTAFNGGSGDLYLRLNDTTWMSLYRVPANTPVTITSSTQQAIVNTKYIADFITLVTITLPLEANAVIGDQVLIRGKGVGLWKLAQNTSQIIHIGANDTTTGTGGSLTATNRYDTLIVEKIATNEWSVVASTGTLTRV